MAIPLLWLGLNQLSTGSSQYEYSLLTINARLSYNIARFDMVDLVAISIGTAVAYFVVILTASKRREIA